MSITDNELSHLDEIELKEAYGSKIKISPAEIHWIKGIREIGNSRICWMEQDGDLYETQPENTANVVEPSEQIIQKLSEIGLPTFHLGNVHYTRQGIRAIINRPRRYQERNGLGPLTETETQALQTCMREVESVCQKGLLSLSLAGDAGIVKEFDKVALGLAATHGQIISIDAHLIGFAQYSRITVRCSSEESSTAYIEAVRHALPAQGTVISVGYGSP